MSTNPKDAIGLTKPQLHLVPPALALHAATAMADGAIKYGPYNWREHPVRGTVYVSAALRHLYSYLDGEDRARDSGHLHLAHVAACIGIILDALETGNLIDDRPSKGCAADVIDRLTKKSEPLQLGMGERTPNAVAVAAITTALEQIVTDQASPENYCGAV